MCTQQSQNFAGIVESESSALIVNTLLDSFQQCRAFHDIFGEFPKEQYKTEFINVVRFMALNSFHSPLKVLSSGSDLHQLKSPSGFP